MAEPPKKPGSLRDRIAAFENKGPATPSSPPPAPRPKPGNLQWKPKQLSPPSSPPASTAGDDIVHSDRKVGGMSASDAKETIGAGGSLKERMAALKGRGGFGGMPGAATSPPPRPATEKPKWKPPPVVAVVDPDEPEKASSPPAVDPEASPEPRAEHSEHAETAGDEDKPAEEDPEEEERQRRAAIAARIARLGGARVGMAPPVFGRKPEVKKEVKETDEEKSTAEESSEVHVAGHTTAEDAAATATEKSESASTLDSFESKETTDDSGSGASSVRSPSSMPVPTVPRRAAPPRKRTPKAPPPSAASPSEESTPASILETISPESVPGGILQENQHVSDAVLHGDRQPERTESQIEAILEKVDISLANSSESIEPSTTGTEATEDDVPTPLHKDHTEHKPSDVYGEDETPKPERVSDDVSAAHDVSHAGADLEAPVDVSAEVSEVPAAEPASDAQEEEEEDEIARRKRIAERLSKAGGINPFAAPRPPSRKSTESPPTSPKVERAASIHAPEEGHEQGSVSSATSTHPVEEHEYTAGPTSTQHEQKIVEEDEDEEDEHVESSVTADLRNEQGSPDDLIAYEAAETLSAEGPDEETSAYAHERSDIDNVEEAQAPRAHHEVSHISQSSVHRHHEDREYEDAESDDERIDDHHVEVEADDRSVPQHETAQQHAAHAETSPSHDDRISHHDDEPAAGDTSDVETWSVASHSSSKSSPPSKRRSLPPPRAIPPLPPQQTSAEPEPAPSKEAAGDASDVETQSVGSHSSPSSSPLSKRRSLPPPRAIPPPPQHSFTDPEAAPSRSPLRQSFTASAPVNIVGHSHEVAAEHEDAYVEALDENEEDTALYGKDSDAPEIYDAHHVEHQEEEEEEGEEEFEEPPPPPPRVAVAKRNSIDANAAHPSPAPPVPPAFSRPTSIQSAGHERTVSPSATFAVPQSRKSSLAVATDTSREKEILDDSDVDPIDPTFYSPQRSASLTSPTTYMAPPVLAHEPEEETPEEEAASETEIKHDKEVEHEPDTEHDKQHEPAEEDPEVARRQTIAERMAKLGGIRFGAPPTIPTIRRPQPPPPQEEEEEHTDQPEQSEGHVSVQGEGDEPEQQHEQEEEEDEFARKQRIAARIAGMGGMRFGMPFQAPVPPRPPVGAPAKAEHEADQAAGLKSPPPHRSAPVIPPPPPPVVEHEDEDAEHRAPSISDGEPIEYEESEAEEISHAEVEDDEPPPPVPSRAARPAVPQHAPPVPQGTRPFPRPPVPVVAPRPPPTANTYASSPPAPPAPVHSFSQDSQGDFVMVEDPTSSDEPPPPPPPRHSSSRAPPPRSAPPPPPPPPPPHAPQVESPDGQWEMPTIPSVDFGAETDLSLQWSEDASNYPPPPPQKEGLSRRSSQLPAVRRESSRPPVAEVQLSADDLMAYWGRVGVQVCEAATTFFEKSKKSVVGDGSYVGFVAAVLNAVPNAAQPHPPYDNFGYLIYAQSGPAVQRRVSDIMPGDVIILDDAKLKGHKGLQTYHQTAGAGEPLVGIISDFEVKKSKVKVFQANQHVGQQSVESVSYRLDDLKSGHIKIFRVLEA